MRNKTPSKNSPIYKMIFLVLAISCLTTYVSPPIALLLGLVFAQLFQHPFPNLNNRITSMLLKVSVIGLGFGINVTTAMKASREGIVVTIISIVSIFILGFLFSKLLKTDKIISFLISAGTAICGGSAIAAVSPIIKANEKQISVALGVVFILNSVALFIFPVIGHYFNFSQSQFGLWSAIAIHDTSSVVGAASKYGQEALEIATTVKLARALWIIPTALLATFVFKQKNVKIKIPYFIGFFVLAIIANTYLPIVQNNGSYLVFLAKLGLTLTLFLIGSGLNKDVIKSVGMRPLLQGVMLWVIISVTTLWYVKTMF